MNARLGQFEELVLLTVATLQHDAYGVGIKRELESRLHHPLSIGSVQSALKRMEEKAVLTSTYGEANQRRGGKRKRVYATTFYGNKILEGMKEISTGFRNIIPGSTHELKLI